MIDLYNDISAIKDDVNADGQFGTADTVNVANHAVCSKPEEKK